MTVEHETVRTGFSRAREKLETKCMHERPDPDEFVDDQNKHAEHGKAHTVIADLKNGLGPRWSRPAARRRPLPDTAVTFVLQQVAVRAYSRGKRWIGHPPKRSRGVLQRVKIRQAFLGTICQPDSN